MYPVFCTLVGLAMIATNPGASHAARPGVASEPSWLEEPGSAPPPSVQAKPSLLYQLPDSLLSERASVLTVEVFEQGRRAMRQEIDLPANLPQGSVVELLAEPVNELEILRQLEAAIPGSVRLDISLGEQLIDELSFADLEEETHRLTPRAKEAVGTPRRLDRLVATAEIPLGAQAYEDGRDPACVPHCDDERYDGYLHRCDPRGSCDFCEQYCNDCVLGCPVGPTTHDTSTTTILSQSYYSNLACFFGSPWCTSGCVHPLSSRTLRTRIWRTVNPVRRELEHDAHQRHDLHGDLLAGVRGRVLLAVLPQ